MHPTSVPPARHSFFAPAVSILWSFPAVCFTLTLITDITYWRSMHLFWHNASSWLLFAGLAVGALAALVYLIGMLVDRHRGDWMVAGLGLGVLLLSLFNSLLHAGDGWTAIVPWGLTLSAITVCLLVVAAFAVSRRGPHHFARASA